MYIGVKEFVDIRMLPVISHLAGVIPEEICIQYPRLHSIVSSAGVGFQFMGGFDWKSHAIPYGYGSVVAMNNSLEIQEGTSPGEHLQHMAHHLQMESGEDLRVRLAYGMSKWKENKVMRFRKYSAPFLYQRGIEFADWEAKIGTVSCAVDELLFHIMGQIMNVNVVMIGAHRR
jgi:hypothetical protein